VNVDHLPTNEQLADIITKTLGRAKLVELQQMLGVIKVN
jgi:hypothetical protein